MMVESFPWQWNWGVFWPFHDINEGLANLVQSGDNTVRNALVTDDDVRFFKFFRQHRNTIDV